MSRASLILIALLLAPSLAFAAGTVTKVLRPQVHVFDDKGQPAGTVAASDIKVPAPIVAMGVGGSVGIKEGGKIIFLRGLDVQTEGLNAVCTPVQSTSRAAGSAYAATNMGLGGAADCKKPGQ